MTLDVLVDFFKGWGALLLGAVGSFLGIRSEWRSRKEHRWKEEDRKRVEEARAAEDARIAWCKEMQLDLEAREFFEVDFDDLEKARWGNDNGYFHLNDKIPGTYMLHRRTRAY